MRRLLFIDRDGTLIHEPPDFQIDAYDKIRFVDGMIPALLALRDAGFEFVMVTNQDGLGTPSFPREAFAGPQRLLLQLLASQGIEFREICIDESFEHEGCDTRKPGVGMLMHYLRDRDIDLARSAVIGDRDTDLQLARNLGCRGFRLGHEGLAWPDIAHALARAPRTANVERRTRETSIVVDVDLDREADPAVATGHGFFDHMLEQLGKHGGFALRLQCAGDLHIDEHHTVEDCALAIGQCLRQALGQKRGVARFGAAAEHAGAGDAASRPGRVDFAAPMDETLAQAALDLSGRACFVFDGTFARAEVGGLATELVPHFFRSLCDAGGINLHLWVRGENTHHQVEACFKAVARALRAAVRLEGNALPSTKGVL